MPEHNMVTTPSGAQLFVRDWGEGPPVLLLSGWAMSSDLWGEAMLHLGAAGLRAIANDRRGHGRSSDPGIVSDDLLADDLAAVLGDLDLSGVTLVTHSGAGGEAVRYLARHGAARVAGLVLVGTTLPCPMRRPDNPDGIDPALFEAQREELIHDLAGWIGRNARPFVSPETPQLTLDWLSQMVLGCSRRILVDYQRLIVESDFRKELAAIGLPVTLLHGDAHVSAPLDLTARRVAVMLPHAELKIYEGAGHGPMVTHANRLAADIVTVAALA